MLPIGTKVRSKYNEFVKGTIIGYGFISDSYAWWAGAETSDRMEPTYLVALEERLDLTKSPTPTMVSVMVVREYASVEADD